MREALCRLFSLVAVLVYYSHKCIPLPLRNNTIHVNKMRIIKSSSRNATENSSSLQFQVHTVISSQQTTSAYYTTHVTFASQTQAPNTVLTIVPKGAGSYSTKGMTTHSNSHLKQRSSVTWQKDFGQESTFISVQSPIRQSKEIPSLSIVYQTAKTRRESVESQMQLAYLWPAALAVLLIVLLVALFTLFWQRGHSLDFVRSASIEYTRQVDPDTKSNLTNMKTLLPMMAAAKGIYGRGRMKELHDVFSRMGEEAPHNMIDACFPEDFTDKKPSSCTRIKLLTPEDIAREDL